MLPTKKIISIYCFLTGTAIIVFWAILLLTNQVPELNEGSKETYFHLTAEFTTSILLITSAIGLWINSNWTKKLTPISLGMLLYANINAMGPYIDQQNYSMVTTFIITIILTIIVIGSIFRHT